MLAAAGLWLGLSGGADRQPSDTAYGRELRVIEWAIVRHEQDGDQPALLRERYRKATLTADFDDMAALEREIDAAIADLGPVDDLVLAKANLALKLHRLDSAVQALEAAPHLKQTPGGRALLADLAQQQGRYADARAVLEEAVALRPDWEGLARLAYFRAMTGAPDEADRLYARAQDQLTAKEMRHYAWLELQRGVIDLDVGRHEAALAHYRHADRAYSGYWLIEEHMAEVLALLGRGRESAEIYARVLPSAAKPELMAAYACVIAEREPARSRELVRAAQAAFEQQMERYPEAAVGHYLTYLIDTESDRSRLIELARLNLSARPNADARLLLARACVKAGCIAEARELAAEIEASGWRPGGLARLEQSLGTGS
jgi:tetratricopeptide (TPR) repeat protein